ncbi:MAG: DUF1624 domain-containing protein, partial [Nocardioidaceae bacterium]|nr:DUF1624 domain-containing protein [Nocardioidaceae bacterium]
MAATTSRDRSRSPARSGRRIVAVDAARGVALLAMMAVHVLPAVDLDGSVSVGDSLARGRAAAAFAVLAGVALALAYGGRRPLRGRVWAATAGGLVVRCVLIGALGLVLGGIGSGLAIILTYYALLFLLAAPLLAAGARTLGWLALGGCLLVPPAAHLIRSDLPPMRGSSPVWADLGDGGTLLSELLLTGYYPVLAWTTYLCAGMAVGRLDLASRRVAGFLLGGGAALAAASALLSGALVERGQVEGALPPHADRVLTIGTTPTDSWWWLVVAAPHSSTPLDLAHTTATALALLGALLLLAPLLGRPLLPLAWVGGMTLTLYTLHAVALAYEWGPDDLEQRYLTHLLAAFVVAIAWRSWQPRGPLEQLVSWPSRGTVARL